MPMTPQTKMVLGYIGIGVAAALITGAVVWAVMGARLDAVTERTESALQRVADLESKVDSLTASLEAGQLDSGVAGTSSITSEPASMSPTDADTATTTEQFCFIKSGSWEGETPILVVDYAQMLSGDEAAAAATSHGDESPPPNDYYIVNDNPKLREFPADKAMTVRVTSEDEGVAPEGYGMPFGEWYDVLAGMSGGDFVKDRPYWITIENGVIVKLEEPYLP